jgi:iron(III) transport system permease protein
MRPWSWFIEKRDRIFTGLVIVVVGVLVLVPLVMLVWSSLRTGRPGFPGGSFSFIHYETAYSDWSTYLTLIRSFAFAGAVTVLSLVIGALFAWMIERTNMPYREWAYSMMVSPLAIPRMLFGIAWVLLLSGKIGLMNKFFQYALGFRGFDIYSMGGMIWVQTLIEVPTAFLMVLGSLRSMDPSLEEAASVSRSGTLKTMRKITFPIMTPAMLAAAVFLFTVNIEVFEIPGIIGLPAGITIFSTAIYLNANVLTPPNYGLANTYAMTFLVLSIILVALYRKETRFAEQYSTITGKGYRPRVIDLGAGRYVAFLIFAVFFIVTILLPILILIYASLLPLYEVPHADILTKISLQNYVSIINAPWLWKVLKNTILLMAVAPTATIFVAALVAWVVYRTPISKKWKGMIDILSFLPQATPSIVIALCLLLVFLHVRFIPIYGTIWIIILSSVIRYLPYSSRTIGAAVIQIHKELEESAQICRASGMKSFMRITLPLIAPAVVNAWIWVSMQSVRALSAALMLYSSKNEVLSTRIWEIWYEGDIAKVSALAVMMIAVLLLVSLIGRMVSAKLSHR